VQSSHKGIYERLAVGKTARFDAKLVHLLGCAARAFAENGYEKTSIRQVAKSAGFSLSNIYYYVASKEELLFLIQYHTFGRLVERLETILERDASPQQHLKEMVHMHVGYLVEHLPELRVCVTELHSLSGEYYKKVLVRRQRYFELTRGIVRRIGGVVEPNLATLFLFGMLNWIVMWFDADKNEPHQLADSLYLLFIKGYKGG